MRGLCGNLTDAFPIIFRWISLKGGGHNLVELFDQAGNLHWRSPREFGPGVACDSVLSSFLSSTGNTFDLRRGDEGSLAYLTCISPSWLPVPSLSGPRYTHYSAHQVLRQFGFDQDIPLVFKDIVPSLPSLDPFLRLQAFSYWSRRSPQFAVPNSQRGVFAFSGYTGYWRRIEKSFVDYVGFGLVRETPSPSIASAPTSNRRLSLPTAGIVSAAVSSKTGFTKWHASRGGCVTFAQDFPGTWLGCSLIIGTSSGVPIKKGAVETIGAVATSGKGKDVKPEKTKTVDVEESTEGVKTGSKTKRRKTGKSQTHLVSQEDK